MKLTQDHFSAHDNHLHDTIRDAAWSSLNDFTFGLLPSSTPGDSLQLDFYSDEVIIKTCKALTAGGARIDVTAQSSPLRLSVLTIPTEGYGRKQAEYYVGIAINLFKPIAIGEPNPQTTPLRLPYAMPTLTLELSEKNQLGVNESSQYWLPVGKIQIEGNGWRLDKQYIPPCTKVLVHTALRNFHARQGSLLEELVEKAIIVTKNAQSVGTQQDHQLAQSIGGMADRLLSVLATSYDYYSLYIPQQAPVHIVLFFKQLSRTLIYYLKGLRDTDRESMFIYIKEYTGKEYAIYNASFEAMQKVVYVHADIQPSLAAIETFTALLNTLFDTLTELSFVKNPSAGAAKPQSGFWR